MNEGLSQIATLLHQAGLKRIIFEEESGEENSILTMSIFRINDKGGYESVKNKISYNYLLDSNIDFLSVILGNMILPNINNEDKEEN